jgi:GntR family transcriptional repressor for pyruvate dehydrogenase complex
MKRATGRRSAHGAATVDGKGRSSRDRAGGVLSAPVPRLDLVREVAERLRAQIIAGVFDGDRTLPPEGRLGEAFSVSRTVIREAMRILAAQGLVEVSQGRAPRVRPVDSQTVVETFHTYLQREDHSLLDLIEVRRPLEAVIAALAAERAMPAQIQELEESVRQLSSARQASRQIDADLRFHELLAEATGNPIFPLLLKTLAGLMRCSRQKTLARSGVETTVAGHRAVLAAVQRRDPDAARQAMLDHLTEAERDLRGERE